MKEFKGTKSKWEIVGKYYPNQDEYREVISDGKIICRVHTENFQKAIKKEEAEYNAKIIEIAPELLESLQDLMSSIGGGDKFCKHDFCCNCAWDKANKTINKVIP